MNWWIVGAIGIAAAWLTVGRGWWRDYKLGVHLARMTTHCERVTSFGPMSLSAQDRAAGLESVAFLRTIPRHVVTRELLKNAMVAGSFGRPHRVAAIMRVLDVLVEEGVALGTDDFNRSYGD